MRKILIVTLFVVALAACGTAAQAPTAGGPTTGPIAPGEPSTSSPAATPADPTAQPQPERQPTTEPAPARPSSEPQQPSGQPRPGGGLSVRPPDGLVEAAQAQLAKRLNLKPEQIALQSANKQEWPDSALGCPQAGMAYAQVVTEGFLLIFTDPQQAASYEVHTSMGPAQMLLCQAGRPVDLSIAENLATAASPPASSAGADGPAKDAVEAAKAALAQRIGVAPDQIGVVAAEPAEWRDSSLGCPQPGQVYLQVIVPGYRVVLEAQGQRYEYHTDGGKRAVTC